MAHDANASREDLTELLIGKNPVSYTIDELLTWLIRYRRFMTGDSIDNIGETHFEEEFSRFILYLKNNEVK